MQTLPPGQIAARATMEDRFSSLVPLLVFTSAVTVGAGVVAGCGLAALAGAAGRPETFAALWWGLALTVAGLLASFLHLGHAAKALKAVYGLAHSWLSREAVLAASFLAATLASAVSLLLNASWTEPLILAAAGLGLATTLTIGFVYILPGQRGWRGPGNAFGPLVASFYLGAAVALGCTWAEWPWWLFLPLLVLDLLLALLRLAVFCSTKAVTPIFPRLWGLTSAAHALRLLFGTALPAALALYDARPIPFFIAATIVLDRFALYAGTVQTRPSSEVARVKAERMAQAVKETTGGLRGEP
jgi:DMSO reductase anchor subunit